VRGVNLRRSLRISTIAWMYGVVWMALTNGAHMNQYFRMIGFNDLAFGFMFAMPFAATLGQLIAAILIERSGLKKYQFIYCGAVHRLLWLVIAALPLLLPLPTSVAVTTTIAVLFLSWFMAALAHPAWLTWMGDLIPRRIRGRHMANRTRVSRLIQAVVVIVVSVVMDAVTNRSITGPAGKVIMTAAAQPRLLDTICGVLALAAVFGVIDTLLFGKIREVLSQQDTPRRLTLGQLLVEPLKDRGFRRFAAYGATITFGAAVAGPYFMRNCLENLGFSQLATNSLYMVIGPISGMVAVKVWGKLIDVWGRRPVLLLGTVGTVFSVVPNFFAAPQTPSPQFLAGWLNWVSQAVGGLFGQGEWIICPPGAPLGAYLIVMVSVLIGYAGWTGVMLAKTSVWMGYSDGAGRSKYVAASSVLMSFGGVLGGIVGGMATQSLEFLRNAPIIWGAFLWNNWHVAFVLSMLARASALLWLINMPDPGSGSVRGMLRHMMGNVYNNVGSRLFYPLRVFGWRRAGRNNRSNAKRAKR
jgi:MFS family permease